MIIIKLITRQIIRVIIKINAIVIKSDNASDSIKGLKNLPASGINIVTEINDITHPIRDNTSLIKPWVKANKPDINIDESKIISSQLISIYISSLKDNYN